MQTPSDDEDCSDDEIRQLTAELEKIRADKKQTNSEQSQQIKHAKKYDKKFLNKETGLSNEEEDFSDEEIREMKAELRRIRASKKRNLLEQKKPIQDEINSDKRSLNRERIITDEAVYSSNVDENISKEGVDQMNAELDLILDDKTLEHKQSITDADNSHRKSSSRVASYFQYCCCLKSSRTFNRYIINTVEENQEGSPCAIVSNDLHVKQEREEMNEELSRRSLSNSSFHSVNTDNEVAIKDVSVNVAIQRTTKTTVTSKLDVPIDNLVKIADFELFIRKIGLEQFYPEKLQLSDAMQMKPNETHQDLASIAFMFIRNLVMINFNCRDKMLHDHLHDLHLPGSKLSESINYIDVMLGDDTDNDTVNPLDLILSVFKCSSPMLKQILAAKLFMCQLAIPFVFPVVGNDTMKVSIWPLRSLVIDRKTEKGSSQNSAVDCPCHIVSFLRLGRPTVSKSKLINGVLTDQCHNTFVNRDCPLGTTKRVFSEGMIEVAWYIPSNKSSIPSSVCMFLNLRGNCKVFAEQDKLLSTISSVIVITVDINCLDNTDNQLLINSLHTANTGIILAIDAKKDSKASLKEKLQNYSNINLQYENQTRYIILSKDGQDKGISWINNAMRNTIKELTQDKADLPLSKRLVTCIAEIDENSACFSSIRKMAEEILKLIPKDGASHLIKEHVIPLQGDLWKTWSQKTKDINKSSNYKSLEERGEILNEMMLIRQRQAKVFEQLGSFMKLFISTLQKLLPSRNECVLFVLLLKHFFDDWSRGVHPAYLLQYQSDWQALKSSKEENNSEALDGFKGELVESETNLAQASFGLEHLNREMGQIYEALWYSNATDPYIVKLKNQLPIIAAKLLLLGLPFEIMDGDVANVPMLWVKAVLMSLRDIIGDRKMLALSVLGIQSSGKSTLLNTMFGLQFVVSAGRCTRGVFMQLIPVEENIFPFDYVLVIDTEGLRAPELAQQKYTHDNELATFAIGLSDITIVNIKGENTAELKDVLQISVHAFLRLKLANKNLNLKQSCVFVHQNVPAIDANDKMMHGRQKFVEMLDEMTEEAADQENIAEIKSFNQVIEFDSETDVFYFSDLWQGDPPMCPANPGYSENVVKVRNAILFDLTLKKEKYFSLSNTISRIEDLWNGILKDDFVFSFRNTLELKAYNDMERKCRALTWGLEKFVMEFLRSDAESNLMKCENPNDLDKVIPSIIKRLTMEIKGNLTSMIDELESFVDDNTLKEVMTQWKQKKQNRFKLLADEFICKSKEKINKLKEEILFNKMRMSEQVKHELEINEMARQLALQNEGQTLTDTLLKQRFDDKWNTWVLEFETTNIHEDVSVRDQIEDILCQYFPSNAVFAEKNKSFDEQYFQNMLKLDGSLFCERILEEHISIHKSLLIIKTDNFANCKRQTLDITNKIFRKIDTLLLEINAEDKRLNLSHVTEIVHIINNDIDDHNCNKAKGYKFNLLPPYQAMMLAHVLPYVVIFFTRLNDAYNRKHSPKAQMQAYKGTAWTLFKNLVQSKTEDTIAVSFFRKAIVMTVEEHVSGLLPIDAQDCILCLFSNGKFSLIKDILVNIAELEDFENIQSFIEDPHAFAEAWIISLTNDRLFDKDSDHINAFTRLARSRVSKIFTQLLDSIMQATKSTQSTQPISIWIDHFVKHSNDSNGLPLSNATFVHVIDRTIPDLKNFVEMLEKQLCEMENDVVNSFIEKTANTYKWKTNPVMSIMDKLWGCTEVCMFCGEPCMNTDKNHIVDGYHHKCLQHRPEGIHGMQWVNSGTLEEKFCNHSVNTDNEYEDIRGKSGKYSEYKENFPDWEIAPNSDVSKYWMWIFFKFQKQFIIMHNAKLPKFPVNWATISKVEAIDSLG